MLVTSGPGSKDLNYVFHSAGLHLISTHLTGQQMPRYPGLSGWRVKAGMANTC
jgi:hypothetical protein